MRAKHAKMLVRKFEWRVLKQLSVITLNKFHFTSNNFNYTGLKIV